MTSLPCPAGRPAYPLTVADLEFNVRSLLGNAVFLWEWRPGSTLFLVWRQILRSIPDHTKIFVDIVVGPHYPILRRMGTAPLRRPHAAPTYHPEPSPMTDLRFTERELDVMSVLWRLGSGTVAEVRAEIPDALGYTSILKILQILEEKGHVRHEEEGRAYRYFPTVAAEEAGDEALGRIVDRIFDGSAEWLLARLVAHRPPAPAELARMRRLLEEAEAAGDPGAAGGRDDSGPSPFPLGRDGRSGGEAP